MIWYGLVWLSMVRISFRQHPSEASVKVSLRSDFFGCFREDSVLVWFGIVWYSLVWLGMIRFGLRQHPSEASVKVSSRSNLFCWF